MAAGRPCARADDDRDQDATISLTEAGQIRCTAAESTLARVS